jgi:hypothetical protein
MEGRQRKKRKQATQEPKLKAAKRAAPTKQEYESDKLTEFAKGKWIDSDSQYDEKVVETIYQREMLPDFPQRKMIILDYTSYLERYTISAFPDSPRYLWPNFTETSSETQVKSIIAMVNQKFREGTSGWGRLLWLSSP